jgi:putative FmdB family regulatory protein
MPLYDLQCSACGHAYEAFQAMTQPQPVRCEKCGKKKARRVLVKPPAARDTYEDGHPRKNRGSGIGRKRS